MTQGKEEQESVFLNYISYCFKLHFYKKISLKIKICVTSLLYCINKKGHLGFRVFAPGFFGVFEVKVKFLVYHYLGNSYLFCKLHPSRFHFFIPLQSGVFCLSQDFSQDFDTFLCAPRLSTMIDTKSSLIKKNAFYYKKY